MALADVVDERQEPESAVWEDGEGPIVGELRRKMARLREWSSAALRDQGFDDGEMEFEEYLNMRYRGTESALMMARPTGDEARDPSGGGD